VTRQSIDTLLMQLNNDDGTVREEARGALISRGNLAVPRLQQALFDKDRQTRWEAAKALLEIGKLRQQRLCYP